MRDSIRLVIVVFGLLSATSVFAADLTPADYDFLKTKMNMSKEDVAKISPALWSELHNLINSNISLQDKKKWLASLEAKSLCEDLKKDGTLPADMKC